MQQLQTQLCQQVSAGNNNTTNTIRAMGRDRTTPTLSILQWTPNNKLELIRMLKSCISQCPYFRTLYDPALDELTA
eukprot:11936251-Ditylum_brightwellii.AAC.1